VRANTQDAQEATDTPNPPERLGGALGAFRAENGPSDPRLARLVAAWPMLAEPVRVALDAMVKAAGPGDGQGGAK